MKKRNEKNKFDDVMTNRIGLCDHYRTWSFDAVLVDVVLELSERFKEKTPEIIRWANNTPCNNTRRLKEKGIVLTAADENALTHLTTALQQATIAKFRLIEVLLSYIAYQGEEKNNGK